MGTYIVIRPRDDKESKQASDWCDDLVAGLNKPNHVNGQSHVKVDDIDDLSPADTVTIQPALKQTCDLVFYFGHGDEHFWLTNNKPTIDKSNVSSAAGKAVVSVACKTGRQLGPDAVSAGVICWLGFTIKVPVINPYCGTDPMGDVIVDALTGFSWSLTMQDVRDGLVRKLENLATDYDTGGRFANRPEATIAYFAAKALAGHVVALGNSSHSPL